MFRDMPQSVQVTQGHLQALEGWRKARGDAPGRQLRQVTPEAGRLLALLLAGCPAGDAVEAGAGGGYSTLWLALACRATQPARRLITFESDPIKAELARQSLSAGHVGDVVELREMDALAGLAATPAFSFCFLDAGPDVARTGYELALAKLPAGGLVCVGDAVEQASEFPDFLDAAQADARVDALIVPIGAGLLVCRKTA